MKFSLLINMKMRTIIGIFTFISREILCSAMFSKKEFAIVRNLRFISRINFILSWAEHEKSFIITGPGYRLTPAPKEYSNQPAHPQRCFLSAWRNFASLAIQNAPSEESDQIARICRLIWNSARRTMYGSQLDVTYILRREATSDFLSNKVGQ